MPIHDDVKERWLEALRSGRFKQTQNTLREYDAGENDYRYCCLGVLNTICMPSEMMWDDDRLIPTPAGEQRDLHVEEEFLHPIVAELSGIRDREALTDEEVTIDTEKHGRVTIPADTPLWQLNDGNDTKNIPELSFSEIADVIEKGFVTYREVNRGE